MTLIQRVQDILLKPKETWLVIEAEDGDVAGIYKNYLVYLAAIPAVATFIGFSVIGVGGFGLSFRVPLLAGLANMVVGFVLSLALLYGLSLVVNALAPKFGGTPDALKAFKVVAYSATAGFVGGIFSLLPALSMLGVLAALYALYLLYIGLPVLMKCPEEKAVAYTAVTAVCGVIAGIVLGALSALFTASPLSSISASGGSAPAEITLPGGATVNTAKLDEMGKKMQEASARMEQAQKSGDPSAMGKGVFDILAAATGVTGGPMPVADLKALLPETAAGLPRTASEAQSGGAMGLGGSTAKAVYGADGKQLELSLVDAGGLGGLMSVATWAGATLDRETDKEVEKIYKQGKRTVRESYAKDGSRSEISVVLENSVMVNANGRGIDMAALRAALSSVDLSKLETKKRPEKQ
jgi:Yip1 domain